MTNSKKLAALHEEAHNGLVAEVVRRLMSKPRYAAADPCALRELVEVEVRKGTVTLFGLMRAIERGH